MCLITTKEDRVGRDFDEPPRHVSYYHSGPARRRTSPMPRARRRYSGDDYRRSDASVRYVYRESQPAVDYRRRSVVYVD